MNSNLKQLFTNPLKFFVGEIRRVREDQSGSISITSVFFVIIFAMILGMVMNVGRHADRKIQLQNGSDAAAYTGGVVLSRSMNTLAFTNHLLCDVFALTAYLREARDRNSQYLSGRILNAWNRTAAEFPDVEVMKLDQLAEGIRMKIALEQNLVSAFSEQNAAVSEQLLPTLEQILAQELIPEFQRALVAETPGLANQAASEITGRHGPSEIGLSRDAESDSGSVTGCDYGTSDDFAMQALMWRTDAQAFDSAAETSWSTLPVADPVLDNTGFRAKYKNDAIEQRREMSLDYLRQLNNLMLQDFDRASQMAQFNNLWRGFTRGNLQELLYEEYPDSNLPMQLRFSDTSSCAGNQSIEDDFMFVGVAYWESMNERLPGLFENPLDSDDLAFTQIRLFLPRGRLLYDPTQPPEYQIYRQRNPTHRDLMNQNWTTQIVPATSSSIPAILETDPPGLSEISVPNMGGISVDEFRRINTH